jgi:hypothetical protein
MTKAKIRSPITATFVSRHRQSKCAPDPAYPQGRDLDVSNGAEFTCVKELPYPAPKCGYWAVRCNACSNIAVVTTAGRVDDPRSLRMACRGRQQ